MKPDGLWRLGKCHEVASHNANHPPGWVWSGTASLPEAQGLCQLRLSPKASELPLNPKPHATRSISLLALRAPPIKPKLPWLPSMLFPTSCTSLCDFSEGSEGLGVFSSSSLLSLLGILNSLESPSGATHFPQTSCPCLLAHIFVIIVVYNEA